jgi:hypothetical protein
MPKIQRSDLPEALFRHLLDRVRTRSITEENLLQLLHWIETNPTVPSGPWFKRFGAFTACGDGALLKTFLRSEHSATGTESK